MAVAAEKRTYTIDDLWELSHKVKDRRVELVKGELRELTPSGWEHGRICARVAYLLQQYADREKTGIVLGAEAGCILQAGERPTVRAADAAYIRKERLPQGVVPQRFGEVAPDLAVEVLSPYDTYSEMAEKVSDWLQAGVQIVWVVDPADQTVSVHRAGQPVRVLREGGALSGEDVLPGFECKVSEIFAL